MSDSCLLRCCRELNEACVNPWWCVVLLIENINNNRPCFSLSLSLEGSIHHVRSVQLGKRKQGRFGHSKQGLAELEISPTLTKVTKCHNISHALVWNYYSMFLPVVMCMGDKSNQVLDMSFFPCVLFLSLHIKTRSGIRTCRAWTQ